MIRVALQLVPPMCGSLVFYVGALVKSLVVGAKG
jgi:hypothetical protein